MKVSPFVIVGIVVTLGVIGIFLSGKVISSRAPGGSPIACTMEAKLCPDGSYVARSGPQCEFTPCPTPASGVACGANYGTCGVGYQCIQKCGPPVAREGDAPPGYYCASDEVASRPRMCPICLALNTAIDAPSGSVKVQDLTVGMKVWSKDGDGNKIIVPIVRISKTPVPPTHQVVHLKLADGREVWVSPKHPLINGTTIGGLKAGDQYDGSLVTIAELVPYRDSATYDILPESSSGIYWANSIPLRSTLTQ